MTGSSRIACAVAALALALGGTAPTAAGGQPPDRAAASPKDADMTFAWDLHRRLAAADGAGNLFFSPYSIGSALGMTLLGARGETAREMSAVLHADAGWHERMQGRRAALAGRRDAGERPYELTVANALWLQEGYPLRDAFLDLTHRHYGAAPRLTDFRGAAAAAVQQINDWVAAETNQRIKDLLTRDGVTPDTRLVLTNAIYFKSAWQTPFQEAATGPEQFHLVDGSQASVPMMRQVGRFGYRELDGAQALRLPYEGHELAMLVVLPRTAQGLADLEASLDAGQLLDLAAGDELPTRRVEVHLPRWRLEASLELTPQLAALGMPAALAAGTADFSGMTGGRDLFIGAVVHKAFVEVDEQGTEAAAATGVIMMPTSIAAPEEEPVVFKADRPFLFSIVHRSSRTILFLGRLTDPS